MYAKKSDLQIISVEREAAFLPAQRSSFQRHPAAKASIKRRRKRKRQMRRRIITGAIVSAAAVFLFMCYRADLFGGLSETETRHVKAERLQKKIETAGQREYPEELKELLEQNEEAYDFVKDYPNRDAYKGKDIDISGDCKEGSVPLLMQWDKRWGYDLYGDAMIGIAGCGPTCMTMAYVYHTGDTQMNPRSMAEFAQENGFHTADGTSWDFWTLGASALGLYGEVISLSENAMKGVLDAGGVIVCSMAPGDFTTTGHFILLRGYDENGFFVNDPNREKNSGKQWDYDTLASQIKNLWGIYPS